MCSKIFAIKEVSGKYMNHLRLGINIRATDKNKGE